MATRPDERTEEDFASRLIELDEALAGETPLPADDTAALEPLAERLRSAKACLERIERFRATEQDSRKARDASADLVEDTFDPDALPQRIGRFQILRELGRGGYGVVFLAHDPNLQRNVALKVPRPEVMLTAELRQRFLREAKAAAALNHAHVVPVFEVGSAGPIAFMATAYCDGPSLAGWLAQHDVPISPRTAAQLIVTLAEAVQHAHSRGVVHRDLKPGNILLETRSAEGDDAPDKFEPVLELEKLSPLISDFGLAKVLDAASEETRTTAILGTPSYMAPEQAAGRAKQVGAAADIYALGAILYELLTRQRPFKKSTDLTTLQAVQTEEPIPPRRLRSDVPRDLEAVCLKCLEKEPSRRYATASALADDLNRYLADEPVIAQPISRATRLARWCRRNPVVAGLTTTATLLLIVVAVVATVGYVRTSASLERESAQRQIATDALVAEAEQRREAERQQAEAERQKVEAELQRDLAETNLHEALRAVDEYLMQVSNHRLFDEPGMQPLRRELLKSAVEYYLRFVERYGEDPELQHDLASAYWRVGQINSDLGSTDEARESLARAIEITTELLAASPDNRADENLLSKTFGELANLERRAGNQQEAADAAKSALDSARRLVEFEPDNRRHELRLGTALNTYAAALKRLDRRDESAAHYGEAIEILESLLATEPENIQYRRDLALACTNRSGLAQGDDIGVRLNYTARAISLYEGLPEKEKYRLHDRWSLGVTYGHQGRLRRQLADGAAAFASLERSREILELLVADNPSVKNYQRSLLSTMATLAPLLDDIARPAEAVEVYRDYLAMLERSRDSQSDPAAHDRLATLARGSLATLDLRHGLRNAHDGISDLEAALALNPRHFSFHSALGIAYYRIGDVEAAQGPLTRATTFHPLAIALKTNWPWVVYRDGAMANYYLAMTQFRLGEIDLALVSFEKAEDWSDRFRAAIPTGQGGEASFEDFVDRVIEPLRTEAAALIEADIN